MRYEQGHSAADGRCLCRFSCSKLDSGAVRLQFRIWIREPVTLLIAAGAAAGLLQLVLLIPEKRLKTVMIVLWSAAMKSVTSTAIEPGT